MPVVVWTGPVLAAAVAVGVVVNHWVRPFAETEVQGIKLEVLLKPLLTADRAVALVRARPGVQFVQPGPLSRR